MSRTKTKELSHFNIDSNGVMSWDWDVLLEEVKQATSKFKPKNLVEETETKLMKTRKKNNE